MKTTRAPFQVLVFPVTFDEKSNEPLYATFRRNKETGGYWQGIAGGGEGSESPEEAAVRESNEESGITTNSKLIRLESTSTIPVEYVSGFIWGKDVLVIPEHSFGIEVKSQDFTLSSEHTEYQWLNYKDTRDVLHWDSNKNALWELNHRLSNKPI